MLAIAAVTPLLPPVAASARATVIVVRPALMTESIWQAAPARKERIVTDELGRKLRLRTIDFE